MASTIPEAQMGLMRDGVGQGGGKGKIMFSEGCNLAPLFVDSC